MRIEVEVTQADIDAYDEKTQEPDPIVAAVARAIKGAMDGTVVVDWANCFVVKPGGHLLKPEDRTIFSLPDHVSDWMEDLFHNGCVGFPKKIISPISFVLESREEYR